MRRYRKALVIITAIAMVLGSMGMAFAQTATTTTTTTSTTTTSGPTTYTDVTSSTPHAASIYKLTSLGILHGVGANTFDPTGNLTRADFAVIADTMMMGQGAQTAQSAAATSPSGFSDVPAGQWFTGWVNLAVSKGYFHGEGNGLFGPNGNITYDELVTVLDQLMGYGPVINNQPWPNGAVGEASTLGLFNGVDVPAGNVAITRADTAKIVGNALNQFMAATEYYSDGTSRISVGNVTNSQSLMQYALNSYEYKPLNLSSGTTGIITSVPAINTSLPSNEVQIDGTNFIVSPDVQIVNASGNAVSLSSLWGNQVDFVATSSQVGIFSYSSQDGYVPYNTTATQVVYIRALPGNTTVSGATYAGQSVPGAPAPASNQMLVEMPGATSFTTVGVATDAFDSGLTGMTNVEGPSLAGASVSSTDTVNLVEDAAGDITGVTNTAQALGNQGAVITGVSNGVVSYDYSNGSAVLPNAVTPSSTATIGLDGSPSSVSSLAANDVAYVSIPGGSTVTGINAFDKNASGTITSVNTATNGGGQLKVTGVVMNGTTYNTSKYTIANENGTYLAAHDMTSPEVSALVGASATLGFGSDGQTVLYIDTTSTAYAGGIVAQNVYTNATSLQLDVNGQLETYDLAPGTALATIATFPGSNVTAAYSQGDWLRLQLNLNGQVTAIQDLGNAFATSQAGVGTNTFGGNDTTAIPVNPAVGEIAIGTVNNVGPTGITINEATYMVTSGVDQYNTSGGPTVTAPTASSGGTSGIVIGQTNVGVVPSLTTTGAAKAILVEYTGQTAYNYAIVTGVSPNYAPNGTGSSTPTYNVNVLMGPNAMTMTASQATLDGAGILSPSTQGWALGTDSNGNAWAIAMIGFTGTTITSISNVVGPNGTTDTVVSGTPPVYTGTITLSTSQGQPTIDLNGASPSGSATFLGSPAIYNSANAAAGNESQIPTSGNTVTAVVVAVPLGGGTALTKTVILNP